MKALFPLSLQFVWVLLIALELWLAVACWRQRSPRWAVFRLYTTVIVARSVALAILTYGSGQLPYLYVYWYGLLLLSIIKVFVTVEVYNNIFYPSSVVPAIIRKAIISSLAICVAAAAGFSVLFPGESLDQATLLLRNLDRGITFLTLLAFLVLYNLSKWLKLSQSSQGIRIAAGFIFYHAVALCITHVEISATPSVIIALSHMRTATFAITVAIWAISVRREEVYPNYKEADIARLKEHLEQRLESVRSPHT